VVCAPPARGRLSRQEFAVHLRLHVDISPREGFPFPLIKFVPWAAYAALRDGRTFLFEQQEISEALHKQPQENLDRRSFDESIKIMAGADEIRFDID
jgi:hypothetical protein